MYPYRSLLGYCAGPLVGSVTFGIMSSEIVGICAMTDVYRLTVLHFGILHPLGYSSSPVID